MPQQVAPQGGRPSSQRQEQVVRSGGASGGQDMLPKQPPLQQVWPAPQANPQPPQLVELLEMSTQTPSQQLLPWPQAGPEPQDAGPVRPSEGSPSGGSPPPAGPPPGIVLAQTPPEQT
jgi:hypothetical protein